MMLKPKDCTENNDLLFKTNKLINHKIWPLSDVQIQEKSTSRDDGFRPIMNHPRHVRSRTLAHENGSIGRQRTANNDDRESFHCSIGPILVAAQCFGIFPLSGVLSESPKKLAFKKFSPITIYAYGIVIGLLTTASVSIVHMILNLRADTFSIHGGIGAATAGAIFYGNNFIGAMLFMLLAPRWISLQREWRAMERFIDRDKYRPPKLHWKFSTLTAVVMIIALIEHALSIANSLSPTIWSSTLNWTFEEFLQDYISHSHSFLFSVCNYNFGVGVFIFCISKIATFTWNFMDIFIILISIGLAERYKSLNQRLLGNFSNYPRNVDWREIRESYATLSSLVKNVDKNISPIILLSFVNNVYFICLQLLNGLSLGENNLLNTVYFFGSFVFLVGRAVAVILFTSRIHDQSKLALPALYNCPGPVYNIETQRLLQQLTTDEICLTGLRFFSITRNFMLAVAGAIITYEVVLLQFNVATKA